MLVWAFVLLLTIAYFVYHFISSSKKQKNLPPGPTPLPVIGNIHQLDMVNLHLTFDSWAKKYGEIVSARMMNRPLVILNTYKIGKEALVGQADNFAGRYQWEVFGEILGGKGYVMSEGQLWKEQRRHGLQVLRDFGLGRPLQEEMIASETLELFDEIDRTMRSSKDGVNPNIPVKTAVVNIVSRMLFNKRYQHNDEEFVSFQRMFSTALEGSQMALLPEFIPVLRLFPKLCGIDKARENLGPIMQYFRDRVKLLRVQFDLNDDDEPSNFVHAYMQEIEKRAKSKDAAGENSFSDEQLIYNLFDLFVAGFETTATTISWFIVYMLNFPDVQNKMRAEIESEVGQLPAWKDRSKLPYCSAVVCEIQRFASIVPFGEFHTNFEETRLNGYTVPKRSLIILNLWSIMRDEKIFDEPNVFKPERFLDEQGNCKEKLDGFIPFSMGKRVCMGEGLARMEMFLFMTALVYKYNLTAPGDGLPSMEPVPQFTLATKPFKAVFTPIN